jgi:hypothetical protein
VTCNYKKRPKLVDLGIPGFPAVEVASEAEIIAKGALHVCPKKADCKDNLVPDSKEVPCSVCGEICYMAPSGQRLQAQDTTGKCPVICMSCCTLLLLGPSL